MNLRHLLSIDYFVFRLVQTMVHGTIQTRTSETFALQSSGVSIDHKKRGMKVVDSFLRKISSRLGETVVLLD